MSHPTSNILGNQTSSPWGRPGGEKQLGEDRLAYVPHRLSSVFHFCPRCGSIHFVPNDFKSMRCEDCGFVYYLNASAATAALIFNSRDELLVIHRRDEPKKGMPDLPGGFVDFGESIEQGVAREVKEETNLDIKLHEEYRYEIHYSPKEGVDKTVVFFLAENMSNEVKKQDCEIANIGWFNYKEAKEILTYDIARELLEKSYNDLKKYKQK